MKLNRFIKTHLKKMGDNFKEILKNSDKDWKVTRLYKSNDDVFVADLYCSEMDLKLEGIPITAIVDWSRTENIITLLESIELEESETKSKNVLPKQLETLYESKKELEHNTSDTIREVDSILAYYKTRRGIGHTTTQINGLTKPKTNLWSRLKFLFTGKLETKINSEPILLVRGERIRNELKEKYPHMNIQNGSKLPTNIIFENKPLVVEHFYQQQLLSELRNLVNTQSDLFYKLFDVATNN